MNERGRRGRVVLRSCGKRSISVALPKKCASAGRSSGLSPLQFFNTRVSDHSVLHMFGRVAVRSQSVILGSWLRTAAIQHFCFPLTFHMLTSAHAHTPSLCLLILPVAVCQTSMQHQPCHSIDPTGAVLGHGLRGR